MSVFFVTFMSQVKGMLLTVAISTPVLACVLKIVELGGRYFYVYVWGFMFVFSIIMLTIAPVLIMPIFNKYTPLEVRRMFAPFGGEGGASAPSAVSA